MSKEKRKNPFERFGGSEEGQSPLDLIPTAKKVVRIRTWEKKNKAFSYRIPERLREAAIEVRESILSIATFDEDGNLRMDRTTVDDVASALIGYALAKAKEENLTFAPTRAGKMTLDWEEAEKGWKTPITLKKVPPRKRKAKPKQVFLGYRWDGKYHLEIEKLAGSVRPVVHREDGSKVNNPHRFSVPPGEIVVRLLQRAIKAYIARELRLATRPETAAQKITGWSST